METYASNWLTAIITTIKQQLIQHKDLIFGENINKACFTLNLTTEDIK